MIINGNKIADNLLNNLVSEVQKTSIIPGLATILIGDDPASHSYVNAKIKACQKIGFYSEKILLPENTTQEAVLELISQLNNNPKIHGILVQLPLPKHIDDSVILDAVIPEKDVDCFHSSNLGRLFSGVSFFAPCTPMGIMFLLDTMQDIFPLQSKQALVIGTSNIVGKPLGIMLLNRGVTVTYAHIYTKNLKKLCLDADLIISATGTAHLISEDMVKDGVVLIDVGMNRIPAQNHKGYILTGDMDFDSLQHKALAITPVPGGVGPMTIASLLYNTWILAQNLDKKNHLI